MIRLFRNKKKVSIKGRMPGNHLLVPGMYYEKVYLKFFVFSFDAYSICERNEEKVMRK